MSQTKPRYTTTDTWEPTTVNIKLEVGLSGVCNRCNTELVEAESDIIRLECPECGYLCGLVVSFPDLTEGGEAGDAAEWPSQKEDWEIDDGRATLELGVRGKHIDCGKFVKNVANSAFGSTRIACDGCDRQFGAAYQVNTLIDPPNGINKLEENQQTGT